MSNVEYLLMMAGFAFFVVVILMGVGCAVVLLKDYVVKLRRRYQHKHRFDKPPTAQCSCVDCKWHGEEDNRCFKFEGWCTADSWFCWDATSKTKE